MLKDQTVKTARHLMEGEISDLTVPTLMLHAVEQKLSGELILQEKLNVLRIFFDRGMVIHTDSTREEERLGNLILNRGRLSRVQLMKAERRQQGVPLLRRFMPEKRFGEILLAMGAISHMELKGFLEYQTRQRLLNTFALHSGRYEFHLEEINRFSLTDIPIQVDIHAVIYDGIKGSTSARCLKDFYELIRHAWPIRLRSELKNISLSLTSKDAFILTRLEGASGIDEVLRSCNIPYEELMRTIFALFCCDVLSIAEIKREKILHTAELQPLEVEHEETVITTHPLRQLKLVPPVSTEQVPLLQEPYHQVSNCFRLLWAKIRAFHEQDNRQVFCVTSGDTEEGKSFLAVNLALACAESPEYKVLLIDGDLHHPSVQKMLGFAADYGLSNYLVEASPEKANSQPLRICKVNRLHVLTDGNPVFNATELMGSGALRDLLQRLRREYEIIIIDSPPYLPLVDTKILTDLSDGILLAVRQGVTKLRNLKRLSKELNTSKIIGFIFDDADLPTRTRHYGHYYYHG